MKDVELQAERKAFEAWYEAYCMPSEADWFRRDVDDESEYHHAITADAWAAWQARAAVEADRAQRVPDDVVNYVRGIYAFLESVAPAGLAEEAFRLPPSATRNQEALFGSLPDHTPGGFPSSSGQVGGGERESQAAIGLSALLASTPAQPAQQEPSEAEMVCAEAYQVVGCLLSDLGLFETEAARKILDNLSEARMVHQDVLPWESAAQHQEPPQQERKPMTEDALVDGFCGARHSNQFVSVFIAGARFAERHHGIKE